MFLPAPVLRTEQNKKTSDGFLVGGFFSDGLDGLASWCVGCIRFIYRLQFIIEAGFDNDITSHFISNHNVNFFHDRKLSVLLFDFCFSVFLFLKSNTTIIALMVNFVNDGELLCAASPGFAS